MLMHWKSKVGVGKVRGALTGYVQVESGSVVCDGVSITCMGHPTAPYPSLGSGPSRPTDLGDLLAQDFPAEIEDEIILPKKLVRQISQATNL